MKTWIIFDWDRTLYDIDSADLFPDALETLEYLKSKYRLAIVSLVKKESDIEKNKKLIREHAVEKYFDHIEFAEGDKEALYEGVVAQFDLLPEEIVFVDDRMTRGIEWGNQYGSDTIWLRNGKFAHETPNEETGEPSHIIAELSELKDIL